jgi:hypothetical protein
VDAIDLVRAYLEENGLEARSSYGNGIIKLPSNRVDVGPLRVVAEGTEIHLKKHIGKTAMHQGQECKVFSIVGIFDLHDPNSLQGILEMVKDESSKGFFSPPLGDTLSVEEA